MINNPDEYMLKQAMCGNGLTAETYLIGCSKLKRVFNIKNGLASLDYTKLNNKFIEEYLPNRPTIEIPFNEIVDMRAIYSEPSIDVAYLVLIRISEKYN